MTEPDDVSETCLTSSQQIFKNEFDSDGDIRNYEAVCPYCFVENDDTWEKNLRDGETVNATCDNCNKEFQITCDITVSYTTCRINEDPNND